MMFAYIKKRLSLRIKVNEAHTVAGNYYTYVINGHIVKVV